MTRIPIGRRKPPRRSPKPAPKLVPVALIPVAAAQEVAEQYGLRQVILLAWDGKTNHCVTYGDSVQDSDQAALGGDRLKAALGWPAETTGHLPPRVQEIQDRLTLLSAAALAVVEWYEVNTIPLSASQPFEALRALVLHSPSPKTLLQERITRLESAAQRVVDDWDEDASDYTPNVERLRDEINRR